MRGVRLEICERCSVSVDPSGDLGGPVVQPKPFVELIECVSVCNHIFDESVGRRAEDFQGNSNVFNFNFTIELASCELDSTLTGCVVLRNTTTLLLNTNSPLPWSSATLSIRPTMLLLRARCEGLNRVKGKWQSSRDGAQCNPVVIAKETTISQIPDSH